MPNGSVRFTRWLGLTAVMAALLAGLLATSAGIAVAAEPGEDMPPVVSNGTILPSSLPYLGGTVAIAADVVDDVGVVSVWVDVTCFDGWYSVELAVTEGTTYGATVGVGPNFTDSPVSCTVVVNANDTNGATQMEWIGEIQIDGQPQFDEAPVVSNPSVEPRELPSSGGVVTIGVDAFDTRGISEALATIALPGGGSTTVPLEPISSSRFEGTFLAPANSGTTAQQYAIEMTAYDDIGQSASVDGGVVTVAAAVNACAGRLVVTPGARSPCVPLPVRRGAGRAGSALR